MVTISVLSKEFIRVPVSAQEAGGAVDPTTDAVTMAFRAAGDAAAPVFAGAQWETASGIHYARALIGPGTSFVLAAGIYDVLVKVTDNPEVPVLQAGQIQVV